MHPAMCAVKPEGCSTRAGNAQVSVIVEIEICRALKISAAFMAST